MSHQEGTAEAPIIVASDQSERDIVGTGTFQDPYIFIHHEPDKQLPSPSVTSKPSRQELVSFLTCFEFEALSAADGILSPDLNMISGPQQAQYSCDFTMKRELSFPISPVAPESSFSSSPITALGTKKRDNSLLDDLEWQLHDEKRVKSSIKWSDCENDTPVDILDTYDIVPSNEDSIASDFFNQEEEHEKGFYDDDRWCLWKQNNSSVVSLSPSSTTSADSMPMSTETASSWDWNIDFDFGCYPDTISDMLSESSLAYRNPWNEFCHIISDQSPGKMHPKAFNYFSATESHITSNDDHCASSGATCCMANHQWGQDSQGFPFSLVTGREEPAVLSGSSTGHGPTTTKLKTRNDKEPRYRCPVRSCERNFRSNWFHRKDHLSQHLRVTHLKTEEDLVPRFCSYTGCEYSESSRPGLRAFKTFREYSRHCKMRHGESMYDCSVQGCPRVGAHGYSTPGGLLRHQRDKHPEIMDTYCGYQDAVFDVLANLPRIGENSGR